MNKTVDEVIEDMIPDDLSMPDTNFQEIMIENMIIPGDLTSMVGDDGWSWKTNDGKTVKINGYSIHGGILEWSDGDDYGLVPGPGDGSVFDEEAPVLDEHHWYECEAFLDLDYEMIDNLRIRTRSPRRAYEWLKTVITCMIMHAMSTIC